ncbi:MAG: hypothetical protein WC501_01605 [Candidatus Micrarchaeia archaeon]
MKGQSSFELFTTVAIMMAFLVPAVLLFFAISSQNLEETSKLQSDVVLRKIAHSINNVYLGGENTTKSILVNLPSNAKSLNITNEEVLIVLEISGKEFQSSYPLILPKNKMIGELNTNKKGLFWIKIEHKVNQIIVSD